MGLWSHDRRFTEYRATSRSGSAVGRSKHTTDRRTGCPSATLMSSSLLRKSAHWDAGTIDLSGVTVIIPAHNEEQALPLVLAALPSVGRVVIVDNDSTDATPIVAARCGAHVVKETRRGYGSACLAGLHELATDVEMGARPPRVVVFLDADFSDYPELLPNLVAPILHGQAKFVLGSRLLGSREPGAMPAMSVWGNRLACWLMRCIWGANYTDLGPFRAIGYDDLLALEMRDAGFGWTIEMQIKAAVAGLRTLEVPTPYRRRIGTSKISGTWIGAFRAGAKILYTIAKYRCRLGGKSDVIIHDD
jgi:glycosyltransferase involved in cell wall biosynthesis